MGVVWQEYKVRECWVGLEYRVRECWGGLARGTR